MADYKVVFRADGGGGGKPASWEPGCPLLVKAIQVARNTQTGEAYLQLKLWNLTDEVVESFTLLAEVTYRDGTQETLEVSPLDADIARGCSYRPEPVALAQGAVTAASARVVAAAYGDTTWHSEQPVITTPQQPLDLSEGALTERRILIADLGKPADEYSTRAFAGDGWWVCPCGTPNVGRERCVACSMPIGTLRKLEDEDYLTTKAAERAAAEKARARKKRRRALTLSALGVAILAVVAFLTIQPLLAHQALPSCYVPSTMTIYHEDGEPYATWSYSVNEQGALSEIQGTTTTKVHLEDDNAGTTSSDSPINAKYVASLSPDKAGFPLSMTAHQWIEGEDSSGEESEMTSTAEVSISETDENGLPLKATVVLGPGQTYHYQLAYHPDGALRSISFETANYATSATYNEYGLPQEGTTSTADGMSVTTYSYAEEGSPTPASCTVHTEDAEGNSTDQTFGYEYDENGNLSQLSIDGVLQYEFTYATVDHATPWTYAIAGTKPFCGVLHGITY